MKSPNEDRVLRPLPAFIFALLSAMAIAASDRIMPPAPAKHGQHA